MEGRKEPPMEETKGYGKEKEEQYNSTITRG